jgi:glycyl-tRNA synthetase beta chain
MRKDLLIEIGLEEVPARFMRGAIEQLTDKMSKWLADARIEHGDIKAYATPRRLAVLVREVADKQQDISEENKGPARKIAVDEQGNWTKAALGFARGQGVQPEELYFKELGGVEYVFAKRSSIGQPTESVLSDGLTAIITSMTFPKNMRWGSYELRFVRPIKWIVALYGSEVIDLEIAGVRSGRTTYGHRFLGQAAELPAPGHYEEALKREFVIADIEEREALIVSQIEKLAQERGWQVPIKDDLLEEVLFLVEYPTVLTGSFETEFLSIPQEVLITSMREHQRYFPVLDSAGKLLPHFITVRNGNDVSLEQVARGNEKVLRARLSDAKFFYEEDQKLPIDTAMSRLENVVFHEELGTIGDKVRRLRKVADQLIETCRLASEDAAIVQRAAAICKFDLVTQMVYEFPELQGVMGMDYARKAGEPEGVAVAINEHYQPRYSGDASPATLPGAIVSIADKIDTIAGCFAIGIIPTGSQDPYALRRQAQGIVQIILDHKLPLSLNQLFNIALSVYRDARPEALKRSEADIARDMMDFFGLRVKHVLGEIARYDIVDAVMASGYTDVVSTVRRCRALAQAVQELPEMKTICDSFTRVMNLSAKAETGGVPDEQLFQDVSEHQLYAAWRDVHQAAELRLANGDEEQALQELMRLTGPITSYFDSVMVMAEDERIRTNRLRTLKLIDEDLRKLADFNKLVWS